MAADESGLIVGDPTDQGDGPNVDPNVANPTYIGTERAQQQASSRSGGSGGSGTLDVRVSHLEVRLDRVENKIDTIIDRMGTIATKAETRNYLWLAIATFVAVVGLLIAGMGWLETRASRIDASSSPTTQPIVIQLPQPASPVTPKK